MAITPIPTSRVSDQLVRSRLLTQLQFDQRDLFRIQSQVSTGRRIFLPSEDAPAALRAMGLQRLIERKTQVSVNLTTNQSFLAAADTAMSSISGLLAEIRGAAISVADTTNSATQRLAVAASVERAIEQLMDAGNQRFRGRYLFAGSRTTVLPFQNQNGYVSYLGNENELNSYSDIDVLFSSSINGNDVFGALSEPVRGAADLNPALTANTLLADLRGGRGISAGSLAISDGTQTSIVDISSAVTVGDLARLIEAKPPSGRALSVTIKPTGIDIAIDAAGGGSFMIREVAGGTTASELGIRRETSGTISPIVGQDLAPLLRLTTRLDDILGARAHAQLVSSGANNDLLLEAKTAGPELNGVTVQFVDDELLEAAPGVAAGDEYASYSESARAARAALSLSGADNDLVLVANTPGLDFNNVKIVITNAGDVKNNPTAAYTDVAGVRTLTLGIDDSDETTVADLVAAIEANTPFTVEADPSAGEGFDGAAVVRTSDAGLVGGNTGNSGGAAKTLFVNIRAGLTTAMQAAAAINAEGTFGATIDTRDAVNRLQAGSGVVQLDATATTSGGSGIVFDRDSGIRINNGGETFDISFTSAETVEDLLNIINGSGAGALAEINSAGTGINVRSRLSGADFSIGENGGTTAAELGIRSFHRDVELSALNFGAGVQIAEGTDFTITSNNGLELAIDLTGAATIGDVLDRINNHPDNLGGQITAQLSRYGNGIELVDDNPTGGQSLQVTAATLSRAAEHLGLIESGSQTSPAPTPAVAPVATLNLTGANTDLLLTANQAGTELNGAKIVFVNSAAVGDQALVSFDAGTNTLTVDVDPTATRAETVADAITLEGTFTASLDTSGGPNTGQGLVVDTGLVGTASAGEPEFLTGRDVNPAETRGVFNTLIRLRGALNANNILEIQRSLELLDEDLERVNFGRAEIGARQQGLDVLQARLDTEDIELRGALSLEIEVDLTEAITNMTARQYAYQASLRTTASIMQLSLLDYL